MIVGLGVWGIVGAAGADGPSPIAVGADGPIPVDVGIDGPISDAVGATPHAPAGCAGAGDVRGSIPPCGGTGDIAGPRVSGRVIAMVSVSGAAGAAGETPGTGEAIGEGACGIVADTFGASSTTRAICTVMLS